MVLADWEREDYSAWIRGLPAPDKPCVPIGDTGGRKLYGASAEDCVRDLTPAELYDGRRCPPDELKDHTIPSRYCVQGSGSYLGRLVRLRDVALTVSEDLDDTRDQPYACSGQWSGVVGIALGKRIVPLASVTGELELTCERGWNETRSFVPDRGTGRPAHCQPSCEPWVWKKQTLIVRPTAAGLLLVLPPTGIDPKYLRAQVF
jgi:hypothetical protein